MIRFKTAVALLFMASAASAQAYTGNELLDGLREGQKIGSTSPANLLKAGLARGHIGALSESYRALEVFCPPSAVTVAQVEDLVLKFLADNPAERHKSATSLTTKALLNAFPCKAPE